DRLLEYFSDLALRQELIGIEAELLSGLDRYQADESPTWKLPLPNVHIGVSVEDQPWAHRVIDLLQVPAAVHFVSYEPALGNVDWTRIEGRVGGTYFNALSGRWDDDCICGPALDWIIAGGESGPGARPSQLAWYRKTQAQCREHKVAFFMKQTGAFAITAIAAEANGGQALGKVAQNEHGHLVEGWRLLTKDPKGETLEEWPEDIQVRQWPGQALVKRRGA
ncbi:MAG TPA: DUF5131 family protein, partial [Bryobacteraceae bacterium]|nr:DUF5131 family protein [Bryobacteraceae bacterium]